MLNPVQGGTYMFSVDTDVAFTDVKLYGYLTYGCRDIPLVNYYTVQSTIAVWNASVFCPNPVFPSSFVTFFAMQWKRKDVEWGISLYT